MFGYRSAPGRTSPKAKRAPKTVLVVEDEESLCALLQDELGALGYKVKTAKDGLEGLARINEFHPDVIICDRAMPAMTGYELLERLRGIYPQYKDVPFIFLTALTDMRDKQAVQSLKPFAYLEKPLDFEVLRRTIEKALENQ